MASISKGTEADVPTTMAPTTKLTETEKAERAEKRRCYQKAYRERRKDLLIKGTDKEKAKFRAQIEKERRTRQRRENKTICRETVCMNTQREFVMPPVKRSN